MLKRYGVLFIFLEGRVVYIEVVDFLEMDLFLNVLRCFICRWGLVREICCEREMNFIGVEVEF